MDMPNKDTTPEAYLPKSTYTVSRVAAATKVKGLEKGLESAHASLKKALRERDDMEETEQKKTALLDAGDSDCDDDVESFELGLLGVVDKNRDDPRYRRYIKGGLRDITTAEARVEEPEIVGHMLDAMDEDKADPDLGPLIAVSMPKLTASRAKVLAAAADLTSTEKDLAFLKGTTIPSLMAAWRTEYKKLEGALTTVYPDSSKKVDRFFKPFRKSRKAKKAPDSPATPPADPATPPPVT